MFYAFDLLHLDGEDMTALIAKSKKLGFFRIASAPASGQVHQENGTRIGSSVLTLERGIRELRRVYPDLDLELGHSR